MIILVIVVCGFVTLLYLKWLIISLLPFQIKNCHRRKTKVKRWYILLLSAAFAIMEKNMFIRGYQLYMLYKIVFHRIDFDNLYIECSARK